MPRHSFLAVVLTSILEHIKRGTLLFSVGNVPFSCLLKRTCDVVTTTKQFVSLITREDRYPIACGTQTESTLG